MSKFFLPLIRTSLSTIQEQTEYIRSHWKGGRRWNIIVTSCRLLFSWVLRWLQLSVLPFLVHVIIMHIFPTLTIGAGFFLLLLLVQALFFIILNHWGCSQWQRNLKCQKVPFSICLFHGTLHQAMTCGNHVTQKGDRFTQSKGGLKLTQSPSFLQIGWGGGEVKAENSLIHDIVSCLSITFQEIRKIWKLGSFYLH